MRLERATPALAAAMASAHAQAFDTPWDEEAFEDLLDGDGVFGFVALDEDPLGLVLCRVAAAECEVLTLAVAQWTRKRGVGRALMELALEAAKGVGATAVYLEVDVQNGPAARLYERLGFARVGLRRGYYDRGAAPRADALVMRLDLTSGRL
jgi:[ribosomal protein S18]-alanine N-acetyltransferase